MGESSKTQVQLLFEFSVRQNLPTPQFEDIEQTGPSHMPVFTIRASLVQSDGHVIAEGIGTAKSKKQAKHDAAMALLNNAKAMVKPLSATRNGLSACWSKDYEAASQKAGLGIQKPSIDTCRGDTSEVEGVALRLDKALDLFSSSHVEKQSMESNQSKEYSHRNLAISSIDRSENDLMELCSLFHEMNIGDEFKRMDDSDLNTYQKLGKLEQISCGNLKVIWSENGLKKEKKTAHTYYIKYKTATIAMTQENGLIIHSDKIREEAAKKAYLILKMIFTNNSELSA